MNNRVACAEIFTEAVALVASMVATPVLASSIIITKWVWLLGVFMDVALISTGCVVMVNLD